ncbi:MAG: hypothetical protein ABF859_14005 [Gluconobacter sp.]
MTGSVVRAHSQLLAQKGGSSGGLWSITRRLYEQDPARCDKQGRPFGFVLTGGQVSDYKARDALMKLPVSNPRAILADRRYDSDSFRQNLLIHGILPLIPSRNGREAFQKNRLAVLQGPQSHRAHVQPPQENAPHRDPLRQDRFVLHELSQPRRRKALDQVFC